MRIHAVYHDDPFDLFGFLWIWPGPNRAMLTGMRKLTTRTAGDRIGRLLSFVLFTVLGLVLGLAGCGSGAGDPDPDGGEDARVEPDGDDGESGDAWDGNVDQDGLSGGDPVAGDLDAGELDGGDRAPSRFCSRATGCDLGQTCNLTTGTCEPQAQVRGEVAAISHVFPMRAAPGDFLAIYGEGFYTTLMTDFSASLSVGQESYSAFSMDMDENLLMIQRAAGTGGPVSYTGQSGASQVSGPVETDSALAQVQACGPDDPPATGIPGALAAEAGPHAAGFCDMSKPWPLRVHYPATCGGLRKEPASGPFPVVLILHGDGCLPINYEYLGRHLATWGYLSVVPASADADELRQILAVALDAPEQFFSDLVGLTGGGSAVVVGHSMGSTRTGDMFSAGEDRIGAVIFLGPVTQNSNYPVPGVVFGATGDRQSGPGNYESVFEDLLQPRFLAVIQGGNHSQFTDAKHWEAWAFSDDVASMARNRQFELVQSLSLAYLQHFFGQPELFPIWLSDPGLPDEIVLTSEF